ncbi:hypothetical protein QR680_000780 [Steinernema hermaphroditum]|uniref:Uncharacterized protein n=1 Tax=Steinernema hermaphroditum TaxID=289476 RepID=A0AA39GWN5_9BILA|nr:hypothetical protein QR680_000780 [Steinernema hermaphroditum]
MAVAIVLSILVIYLPIMARGLVCYENDDSGNVHTVNGTKYRFCGIIPATTSRQGRLFALGEENDYFPTYEKTFGVTDSYYRVVTVCMLEEFQFGRHYPKMRTEFIFRCVCNFDLCNAESTFSEYLNAIKITSTMNDSKAVDIAMTSEHTVTLEFHFYALKLLTVDVPYNIRFEQVKRHFAYSQDSFTTRWQFSYGDTVITNDDTPQSLGIQQHGFIRVIYLPTELPLSNVL